MASPCHFPLLSKQIHFLYLAACMVPQEAHLYTLTPLFSLALQCPILLGHWIVPKGD